MDVGADPRLGSLVNWDYGTANRELLNLGLGGMRDVASSSNSNMNRLNQTECAVFKLCIIYFQRIPFSDYLNELIS